MIASFSCIAGTIIILYCVKDKPSTVWTFYLGINSTIAFLTTAAKASLIAAVASCLGQAKWLYFKSRSHRLDKLDLFDRASHSPLGAAKFIFGVNLRFPLFATLGAAVMIFAVALDTFTQQLIALEPGLQYSNDTSALFSYIHDYNSGSQPDTSEDSIYSVDGQSYYLLDDFQASLCAP